MAEADAQVHDPVEMMDFPPLDLSRPAAEQIGEVLKSAILKTTLPPGCLISEKLIGLRAGASRTPVREAFSSLRDEGLIITLPSRGTFVSKLSASRIRSAQFIREALELANVTRLCDAGVPNSARLKVEENLTRQERSIQSGDDLEFQRLDDEFHSILACATGFDRAETVLVREKAALDRLRVLTLGYSDQKPRLLAEHRAIWDAISGAELDRSLTLMRDHLRAILTALDGLVRANRDFFE